MRHYRYLPPPGWPRADDPDWSPEPGWTPPPGWADPSWPPAPQGWNFVVEVPKDGGIAGFGQAEEHPWRAAAAVVVSVAASVSSYLVWLRRDDPLAVDPSQSSVVGCILCLAATAVVVGALRQLWAGLMFIPVVFTGCFSVFEVSQDETGQAAVGALFVFVGLLVSVFTIGGVTSALATRLGQTVRRHRTG